MFLILFPSLPPFKIAHNFLGFSLYIFTITFHSTNSFASRFQTPLIFHIQTLKRFTPLSIYQPNFKVWNVEVHSRLQWRLKKKFVGSKYFNLVNMCFQDLITSFQSLDLGTCLCFDKRFLCIFGNHLWCLEGYTLTMLWHNKTFKLNSPSWKARRIHFVKITFVASFRLMEPSPPFLHSRQQFVNLSQVHVKKSLFDHR